MTIKARIANTHALRAEAFAIRREVFVLGQGVPESVEHDDKEDECTHIVAFADDTMVGASRWRRTETGVKLERFAVKNGFRGIGLGSAMVALTLESINEKYPDGVYVYLHSQIDAIPLYEKFGFQGEGEPFLECEILHRTMFLKI